MSVGVIVVMMYTHKKYLWSFIVMLCFRSFHSGGSGSGLCYWSVHTIVRIVLYQKVGMFAV